MIFFVVVVCSSFILNWNIDRAWIIVVLTANASLQLYALQTHILWFSPRSILSTHLLIISSVTNCMTARVETDCLIKHNIHASTNTTIFRFLMCYSITTLELTQLWSERRRPGFSKVSVYTSVMEDRKRKFTVLVDMQTHKWLRKKKKRLPLLFSEQTRINSKRGVIYILSIIN